MAPKVKKNLEFVLPDTVREFGRNLANYSNHAYRPTYWGFLSHRYEFTDAALRKITKEFKDTLQLADRIVNGDLVGLNDLNSMFDIVGNMYYDQVTNTSWRLKKILDYPVPIVREPIVDYGAPEFKDLKSKNQSAASL